MNIAYVDDDIQFLNDIANKLKVAPVPLETIDCFHNVQSFVKKLSYTSYDVIFLDYRLGHFTGYDLLDKIELGHSFVILVTAYGTINLAQEGYCHHLYRFITKAQISTQLNPLLIELSKQCLAQQTYTIQSDGNVYIISEDDVLAVFSEAHYIYLVLKQEIIHIRFSLNKIKQELETHSFIKIKSNVYVNIHHIVEIKNGVLRLDNGNSFMISKAYVKSCVRSLMENY